MSKYTFLFSASYILLFSLTTTPLNVLSLFNADICLQALEKYRYEQSLEHTSQFIEKLEKELEDYQKHVALFKNREGATSVDEETNVDDSSYSE